MISQTVEYALRAVVNLAGCNPEPRTRDQIAEATRVPKAYLSKVLQSLVRAGIVQAQRGPGGGMTLARAPDELTLLEVVTAVEPLQRIRACPLGLASHGLELCPLHQRLDDAMAAVEEAFRETTLAEIIARPKPSAKRCLFPDATAQRSRR